MSSEFPSVVKHLTPEEQARVRYMRPDAQTGLTILYDGQADRDSLFGAIYMIRRLQLLPNTAIPMHVHPFRKKVYIRQGGGTFRVIVHEAERHLEHFLASAGSSLIIWPAQYHAVMCFSEEPVDILVFTFAGEPTTEWEPSTNELLKNLHLAK